MGRGAKTESLGPRGERLAARFLEKLGYRIMDRNYQARGGEVDLIARDGDELVFVEVKALAETDFGTPEERVGDRKQLRLSRAALQFVRERRAEDVCFRFDVVAVTVGEGEPRIEHFVDAFELHRSIRV